MKTKYDKKKNKKQKREITPRVSEKALARMKLILFIALSIIMFYPPFVRGLYFELEQLPAIIFTLSTFVVFWIYKYLKRDDKFLETPLEYAAFAFTAVYFISIFAAVGTRQAIFEWLKYCMYFAVFYILSELADSRKWRIAALWVIAASATGVAVLGIDGAAGGQIANVLNAIFKWMGVKRTIFFDTFVGGRVNSTLQYPNALAAYLMAVYFICLGLVISSEKLWTKVIGGALSSLLFITFLLTTSRGAYILFPVVAIVFFILIPKGSRVRGAASGLAAIIPAIPVFIKITSYIAQSAGNPLKIWISVLIGVAASAFVIVILNYTVKWLEKVSWKVYAAFAGIILVAGTACAIYVLNASAPLVLDNSTAEKDKWNSAAQKETLKPGKEYKLSFEAEASDKEDKPFAYRVVIGSRSISNVLFGGNTQLEVYTGKETKEKEKNEITFKVPEDSRIVDFSFVNYYAGTKAVICNAKIIDTGTGKVYKELMLNNKYLPISFITKFKSLSVEKSSLQRAVYYKDGFNIFKDRWFLGAGGGAWELLYFSYQSYLYWSTQPHNYPLQIAIECGILGLIVLLLMIVSIIYMAVKVYRNTRKEGSKSDILGAAAMSAIAAMLIHSAMDFDLSLSAVFLLLWELAAIFNAVYLEQGKPDKKIKVSINPLLICFLSFTILFVPVFMASARGFRSKAILSLAKNEIGSAAGSMKKASSLDPFMAEYKIDYANMIVQNPARMAKDIDEANRYMTKAEDLNKMDVKLLPKIGAYHLSTGNIQKGLQLFDRAIQLRPFRPEEWQQKINAYMQVALYYFNNNDMKNGMEYLDRTLSIIDEAEEVNKRNMNPFIFNAKTMDMLEKLKYIKDNYNEEKSINMAKTVFYSMNDMDINFDSIPDQWTIHSQEHMKLGYDKDRIKLENTADDKWGYIQSRELELFPGKEYVIEVEAANGSSDRPIVFGITGVTKENKSLEYSGNIYTGEFAIPEDFENKNNHLMFYIKGSYEIDSVRIFEK